MAANHSRHLLIGDSRRMCIKTLSREFLISLSLQPAQRYFQSYVSPFKNDHYHDTSGSVYNKFVRTQMHLPHHSVRFCSVE